ncbi:MAG TPA: hypothetical protein VFC78_18370 [Tepidisphaeraceae bacterium]|nr:hypothetical protein [Tepidisphaeraceae bacterium]
MAWMTASCFRWCLTALLALPVCLARAAQGQAAPTFAALSSAPASDFAIIRGAPGYWRIAKTRDGVWWFLSPANTPDFLNSVTTVQPILRGRDAIGPDYNSRDFDEQSAAGLDQWAKATVSRLQDIGFKGVGAWSNPALHKYNIPMTQDLNLCAWTAGSARLFFSAAWPAMIENAIKTQVAPLGANRNLVGYFLDNEMSWDDEAAGPARYFDGLSASDPNRGEVLNTIRATWPSTDAFNKDWKTKIGDWSALNAWPRLPRDGGGYARLMDAWLSHLAQRYFRTTTTLLHKYDPNHLILGIRYRGGAPRPVIRASRGYTDAQSLNYYVSDAKLDPETFRMISRESEQPILISEYSFHALDGRSGDRNTIGFDAQVLDQQARGDAYRLFTTRLARVPYIIGADWFQWMDEPPSGRASDGEDANFGVVDVDDHAYKPLAQAIRATTPLLNKLHQASPSDKQQDVWREGFVSHPAFIVPMLEKPIRINGELSDWPSACKLPALHPAMAIGTERHPLPAPNVYLGWSRTGLTIGLEVFDADVSAAPANGWWWARDCVEFWVSTRPVRPDQDRYDAYCHHFFFVPVDYPVGDGISGVVGQWHSAGDFAGRNLVPNPSIRSVTRILPDRYVTEIFIPAKALHGYDPEHQPQLAFNINVRDYQHAAESFWSAPKAVLTQARPNTWGTLLLAHPTQAPRGNGKLPVADIK